MPIEGALILYTINRPFSPQEYYELGRLYPARDIEDPDTGSSWIWLPAFEHGFQGVRADDMLLVELPFKQPSRYHWQYAINARSGDRWAFDPDEINKEGQ